MNYNSLDAIFSAGTTNMTVLRNNVKQDDGTDTVTGVNWFTFNGVTVNSIYASGNSFFGFGSSSEHLKVNRRDGAMWYLYREEGTLYDYYKFLKIRWQGYTQYNQTADSYALTYDVILWDTGDISLHMVKYPTSYNTGAYQLISSSGTYSYTINATQTDVTFKKTDSGFTVTNSIIDLQLPFEKRYLVRSGTTYYTVVNNTLSEIAVSELTSEVFLTSGIPTCPQYALLAGLTTPEILYWTEEALGAPTQGLVIHGTPSLPQIIYSENQIIPEGQTIDKLEVSSQAALFALTCDGGQTWKYHNGETWLAAADNTEGMNEDILEAITPAQWAELEATAVQFRVVLTNADSFVSKIYFNVAPLQIIEE